MCFDDILCVYIRQHIGMSAIKYCFNADINKTILEFFYSFPFTTEV
jgi:hypothetical protein